MFPWLADSQGAGSEAHVWPCFWELSGADCGMDSLPGRVRSQVTVQGSRLPAMALLKPHGAGGEGSQSQTLGSSTGSRCLGPVNTPPWPKSASWVTLAFTKSPCARDSEPRSFPITAFWRGRCHHLPGKEAPDRFADGTGEHCSSARAGPLHTLQSGTSGCWNPALGPRPPPGGGTWLSPCLPTACVLTAGHGAS